MKSAILVRLLIAIVAVLGILAKPALSGTNNSVVSAASASYCTASMKSVTTHAPAKQALTELRGPAYATIWVNTGLVPSDAAWKIPKNPSWGQTEVKIRVDVGQVVNIYNGAGGTFVQYKVNDANCQLRMVADYNSVALAAKTLDNMRQWQILAYWP